MGRALKAFFAGFDGQRASRELLLDAILMVALADGPPDRAEVDAIARLAAPKGELEGLDWQRILDRMEALAEDAPLFTDARATLLTKLTAPDARRLALELAAKTAAADQPLTGAEEAILSALAQGFAIPEAELEAILAPWRAEPTRDLPWARCPFNDPEAEHAPGLFDTIAATRDPGELRMLVHKVETTRRALTQLLDGGEVSWVGERLMVGGAALRIDACLESQGRRWLLRCLGPGEALHHGEHPLLETLTETLDEATALLVVHADEVISPADEALLRSLAPAKVRLERLG